MSSTSICYIGVYRKDKQFFCQLRWQYYGRTKDHHRLTTRYYTHRTNATVAARRLACKLGLEWEMQDFTKGKENS